MTAAPEPCEGAPAGAAPLAPTAEVIQALRQALQQKTEALETMLRLEFDHAATCPIRTRRCNCKERGAGVRRKDVSFSPQASAPEGPAAGTSDREWLPTDPTLLDLVRELREACGLFSGAMPITPEQAWQEAVMRVRTLCGKRND